MARDRPSDRSVDRLLAELPAHLQPIGRGLRSLVNRSAPELKETVKWSNPMWVGNENAICLMLFPTHINLGFFRGAELSRTFPRMEGTGKNLRHVKIGSVAEASDRSLIPLIREAVRLDRAGRPSHAANPRRAG